MSLVTPEARRSIFEIENHFFSQVIEVDRANSKNTEPFTIEKVNELIRDGLGQEIITRFDDSGHPYEDIAVTVGVALPLNKERTQHIVILISGEKLLIEPDDDTPEAIEIYATNFAGDRDLLLYSATDLNQIADHAFNSSGAGSRVVMRNDNPADSAYLDLMTLRGIHFAQEMAPPAVEAVEQGV